MVVLCFLIFFSFQLLLTEHISVAMGNHENSEFYYHFGHRLHGFTTGTFRQPVSKFFAGSERVRFIITTFHENTFELRYRKLSMNLSGN